MAIVQYNNVYRSGASSGAPVTSLFVCDTFAELNSVAAIPGDIGFVKAFNSPYFYTTGWDPIITQFGNQLKSTDFIIDKTPRPFLAVKDSIAQLSQVRLYNIAGCVHLSTNCWYDGT